MASFCPSGIREKTIICSILQNVLIIEGRYPKEEEFKGAIHKLTGAKFEELWGSNPQIYYIDTQTLATSGAYTVWVAHRNANAGSETLQLNSVPADFTASITENGPSVRVPASGNNALGQNAVLSFSGVSGQKVTITPGNTSFGWNSPCSWSLLDPSNAFITGYYCDVRTVPITATLSSTGTFTIVIDPQGLATGTVTISLTAQ